MKEKLKNKFLGISEPSGDKEKSLIMLCIWLVFIAGVVVYIRTSKHTTNNNSNNTNQVMVSFDSLESIFSKYNNYKYDITISDLNNNIVSYKGTIKDNINDGSRVIGEEVINYKIEDSVILNKDTNEEISDLYGNYLSYFFTPSNIYSYIKFLKGSEKEDGDIKKYNYKYVYDNKDITFDIVTTNKLLDSIEISYNDYKYSIKYSVVE